MSVHLYSTGCFNKEMHNYKRIKGIARKRVCMGSYRTRTVKSVSIQYMHTFICFSTVKSTIERDSYTTRLV